MMTNINNLLKGKNVGSLRLSNGKTLEQNLLAEANYLKTLLEKHLKEYRSRFAPKVYRRTGRLEDSVQVKSEIRFIDGKPTALVYFDDNAIRRSGYGVWSNDNQSGKYDNPKNDDDEENVCLAAVLNDGYVTTKPSWFRDSPNFGFRGGNGFIDKAIMEFNATNSLGIVLDWRDVIMGDF